MQVESITRKGSEVPEDLVEAFRSTLRGRLVRPSDQEYNEARKVHNAMIDRRPAMIAYCQDVADVRACVNFGRENSLAVSVRDGGHGVAGHAVCDDGIVIDMSRMKGVWVDAAKRIVRVQGGCTWGDVDHATHAFGLATPGGIVSTTGVAGLALGGGIGHLTRRCGLSCDNLISADIVTADGSLLTASEHENPDLYWAIRGGGGNFGVATSLEFRLHPVREVYAGLIFWHPDAAPDVLSFYGDFITQAPEELNGILAFTVVPPGPPFPEELHNKTILGVVLSYSGPMDKAEQVMRPLREFGSPIFTHLGPMPFPMLQRVFDPIAGPGMQQYWKGDFVPELTEDLIAVYSKFGPAVPNMFSGLRLFSTTGAAQKVGRNDTAWSYRDAKFTLVIDGATPDPAKIQDIISWVRDTYEAGHPYAAEGGYVNFLGDEGQERVMASYRDNYRRLVEIKRRYDPANLFHMNQNIKPGGA